MTLPPLPDEDRSTDGRAALTVSAITAKPRRKEHAVEVMRRFTRGTTTGQPSGRRYNLGMAFVGR